MKWKAVFLCLLILAVTGCGGPKEDVTIFIMAENGTSSDMTTALETSLRSKLGVSPTISVSGSPIFNLQKLVVELAAGGHGILILPKEQFEGYGRQGGFVSLDDMFKPDQYPEGILEVTERDKDDKPLKTEKHLNGIPMSKIKWFLDAGYTGNELFAFIPQNAPDIAKAKQVLKAITK